MADWMRGRPTGGIVALWLVIGVGPLVAQAPPLTLEAALDTALALNPDLRLAQARIDSAFGERSIARALPNPLVASQPGLPFQYTVTEPIDIGPQRVFRSRESSTGLQATRLDRADAARQVAFAVRQAFYDVLLADSLRALAVERRGIVAQLLAADSVRLRTGEVAERDVSKTALELALADAALAQGSVATHTARLTLQLLIGVSHPDPDRAISGALTFAPIRPPTDSAATATIEERPDVAASRARVQASQAARSFAPALLLPTPAVTAAYQPSAPYDNGTHWAVGVALQVPIFSWSGGERRRAAAGVTAAEVSRDRTEAVARAELATALDTYRADLALVRRYESGLLAQAAAALAAAQYARGAGAASLLDLLDAVRTYADVRADHLVAVHDYLISVAALSRATGQDLLQ